ncbi:MAG: polysaccharide biosynthesis C-terminal domain-containing protein [bacterium]
MTTKHRYITNTLMNIANTAFGFVIAYAMTPFILHRMGTESYGIWVFLGIFSISGYFSLLDFGFQGATIKYIAEFYTKNDREQLERVVNATVFFFFGVGIISAILLFGFNALWLDSVFHIPAAQRSLVSALVMILSASFLFQFPALALSAIVEGLQRYTYLRGVSMLATLLSKAVLLLFLRTDNGLPLVFGATLAGSLVMTILYAVIVRKLLPDIRIGIRRVQRSTLRLLLPLSSKLFASKVVGLVFNNTDKILIGIFLTVAFQTDYDIVNKSHIILLSILSVFNQAALPASSEFFAKKDTSTLQVLLLRSTKYAAAAVMPAFIFLMIYPSNFLGAWVGRDFSHLGPLVQLYCVHIILTMLVGVSSTMLVGINKVGQVLKISLWAAVINLIISVTTIHRFGLAGIIAGTSIAYLLSSAMYIIATNRIFQIRNAQFFHSTLLPIVPSMILTIAGLLAVRPFLHMTSILPWVVVVGITYLAFFVCLYWTGLSNEERRLTREIASRFLHFSRTAHP